LPQQRDEALSKRRIGVGFTGLGDTLVMLGLRYDRPEGRDMAVQISTCMRDTAYLASIQLAQEKGAFPKFNSDAYLSQGNFASRLPIFIQEQIKLHGIRNSHLLSIAPTGTVSLAFADNTSNGIEPAFAWVYLRKKRTSDGKTLNYEVQDHAWRLYRESGGDVDALPDSFVSALQISVSDHIAMMQAVQPLIDTAISKTVNVPEDFPYADFKHLYQTAWKAGLKGLATYRPNQILGSVLEVGHVMPPDTGETSDCVQADPMRSVVERRPKGGLQAVAEKIDYWTSEGHKTLYLLVSFMQVPDAQTDKSRDRAIEFFMPVGQIGESQQWITSSMRLLSLAARGGFLSRALSDMRKVIWERGPVRLGTHLKTDGNVVPMWHDSEVAAIAYAIQMIIESRAIDTPSQPFMNQTEVQHQPVSHVISGKKCRECGAHAVIKKDGCEFCTQCGYTGSCG
jgi:ribonucleoside-diphosphate reductase alpha chain